MGQKARIAGSVEQRGHLLGPFRPAITVLSQGLPELAADSIAVVIARRRVGETPGLRPQ